MYYTATPQQVTAYERKFKLKSETTGEDKRIKDYLLDMSSLLREMKLFMAINGIPSEQSRLDDDKKDKDHDKSVSRRFVAVTHHSGDIDSLACQVEELKLQLVETQSHMDKRVDGIQEQLNQIVDLLPMSSTSFQTK